MHISQGWSLGEVAMSGSTLSRILLSVAEIGGLRILVKGEVEVMTSVDSGASGLDLSTGWMVVDLEFGCEGDCWPEDGSACGEGYTSGAWG